jgi:ubiquinone/menaquinone biosynthesis C-methylase UbiE
MAFEELKERHAAMWGSAPFERIAGTLADMHETIVDAVEGGPGLKWLDVGCGTGELTFMAVATGAEVTGSDLSPTLVETAKRQAAERGVQVTFEVGDAEALPYRDASFDIVTSTVGAIFAPDHRAAASELARVCRAGGKLGMTAWTSGGDVDEFFEIIGSTRRPRRPAPVLPSRGGIRATSNRSSAKRSS